MGRFDPLRRDGDDPLPASPVASSHRLVCRALSCRRLEGPDWSRNAALNVLGRNWLLDFIVSIAECVPGCELHWHLIDQASPSGHTRWHDRDLADDDVFPSEGVIGWLVPAVCSGTGIWLSITRIDHESDLAFCRGAFGLSSDELAGSSRLSSFFRVRPEAEAPIVPTGQFVSPNQRSYVGGFGPVSVEAPAVSSESGFLEEETGPTFMGSQGGHSPRFGANRPKGVGPKKADSSQPIASGDRLWRAVFRRTAGSD